MGFFPVSLLFFASGHKSCLIWESSVSEILAANTRVGPHNRVDCPGAMYLLADGPYNKDIIRALWSLGNTCPWRGATAGAEEQNIETQELVPSLNMLAVL